MNMSKYIFVVIIALMAAPSLEAAEFRRDGQVRAADIGDRDGRRTDRRVDRRQDARGNHRGDRRFDRKRDRRVDRRDDIRDHRQDRWERYVKFRVGMRLLTLPARYHAVRVGSAQYYYTDGVYLVKRGGEYVVVKAPIGAGVSSLPYGFRSVWIGPRRLFVFNSAYYVYQPASKVYVVVEKPVELNDADIAEVDYVFYPAQNQSDEQLAEDRYNCHIWSAEQSGFDPVSDRKAADEQSSRYDRGMKACMTGNGYTVA